MEYPNLKRVLTDLEEFVTSEYRRKLTESRPHRNGNSYDSMASGELYRSADCIVKYSSQGFQVYFTGDDSWINVENGRKPGRGLPTQIIERWMIDRNIQPTGNVTKKGLAYLINRSIKEHGIKAKPFLKEIQEDLKDWNVLILDAIRQDTLLSLDIKLNLPTLTIKI